MAALAVSALGAALALARFGLGIDDSDIFLTYGRNFAEGHGFVWNVGGERVEGFTSLLWTLVCSLPFFLGMPPEQTLLTISVLLCGVSIYAVLRALRSAGAGRLLWAAGPAVILLPYFFVWTTVTLMDSALWTCALGLLVLSVINERSRWAAALAATAVLVRPEAMVVVPAFLAVAAGTHPQGWRRGARVVSLPLASFMAATGAVVTWRLWYFGFPLPNTYYAKISTDLFYEIGNGLAYVLLWCTKEVWPIPLVLLALGSVSRRHDRTASALAAGALAVLAATIASGGDHFAGYRFLQPAVPLLLGLGVLRISTARGGMSVKLPWRALVTGFLTLCALALVRWRSPADADWMQVVFDTSDRGRRVGQALAATYPQLPSIGHVSAGGVGFSYPGTVLDLVGLNWTVMAHSENDRSGRFTDHEAFDEQVFWDHAPDLVLPWLVFPGQLEGLTFRCENDGWWQIHLLFLPGLLTGDRFFASYDLGIVTEDSGGTQIMAFVRRPWSQGRDVRWLEWDHCREGPASIPDPHLRR